MEREAKEALILRLFRSYPGAASSVSRGTVDAYLRAVDGFSLESVSASVEQFTSGKVERHNRSFVPSADELAENVGRWHFAFVARDAKPAPMHTGLVSCDWGNGSVNMRGLTEAEQDLIMKNKGYSPDGKSLAFLGAEQIREILSSPALPGTRKVAIPAMKGMGE